MVHQCIGHFAPNYIRIVRRWGLAVKHNHTSSAGGYIADVTGGHPACFPHGLLREAMVTAPVCVVFDQALTFVLAVFHLKSILDLQGGQNGGAGGEKLLEVRVLWKDAIPPHVRISSLRAALVS